MLVKNKGFFIQEKKRRKEKERKKKKREKKSSSQSCLRGKKAEELSGSSALSAPMSKLSAVACICNSRVRRQRQK